MEDKDLHELATVIGGALWETATEQHTAMALNAAKAVMRYMEEKKKSPNLAQYMGSGNPCAIS